VPKKIVQSEYVFTRDDHTKSLVEEVYVKKEEETKKVNIGTDRSPKYINLGVDCTSEELD
jgi:hypothetical protein